MLLMVMSAATFMVVVMMMMFMLLMVMSAATFMIVVMMMVFMLMYMSAFRAYFFSHQFFLKRYWFLHNFQNFLSFQFLDRSCYNSSFSIDSAEKLHCLLSFLLINDICTAHNNGTCIFNLIIKELAKVSHIHFAFLCINYSCIAVQHNIHISLDTLYCFDNI